jgi:predicted nucleic acid-binding protein
VSFPFVPTRLTPFAVRAKLEKAAELKARYPISLADAWIAAAALLEQADLVHKDPEFEVIVAPQLRLPYQ